MIQNMRDKADSIAGQAFGDYKVELCDDFSYTDPVDNSITEHQGIRILFEDESRIVFRLSGTGTEGATLRVYIERYVTDEDKHDLPTQQALAELIGIANEVAEIRLRSGREAPDVIT